MFSYTYDKKTGGILLNSNFSLSKEPRPVYAEELDILGFSQYFSYERQNEVPYMWAESVNYIYRGEIVAKLKGGNLYEAPQIVINEEVLPSVKRKSLKPINIEKMNEMNSDQLAVLEQQTVRLIKDVYEKRKEQVDCFEVAFSGGKDSAVLLDLVAKVLPQKSYVVIFGDTGMEFPDTYEAVEVTKKLCTKKKIPFYTAVSKFNPLNSWKLFGPPSRTLRWCCSVHKSTPQILLLRELFKKPDCRSYSFVGVRHEESFARSEYEYECFGKKQKGQYSFNPILEWTSAEVWLYIFAKGIFINRAYKKGCARVGCICCPMAGNKSSFIERIIYPEIKEKFLSLILDSNLQESFNGNDYIVRGGWNARKNGSFLKGNNTVYTESVEKDSVHVVVNHPKTDWKEWIKPIGTLLDLGSNRYNLVTSAGNKIEIEITPKGEYGYSARIDLTTNNDLTIVKYLRYVFRKSAYCVLCGTCQSNCRYGCITLEKKVQIENCKHCLDCFDISAGCLAYDSLKIPTGEKSMSEGINCFSNHAPQDEWIEEFFKKEDFLTENSLGPVQQTKFKRFLRDTGLIEGTGNKSKRSVFSELWKSSAFTTWKSENYLALMLVNLLAVEKRTDEGLKFINPQFRWYIEGMESDIRYSKTELVAKLSERGMSQGNTSSVINALTRFSNNSFGTVLHFVHMYNDNDAKMLYYIRSKCQISDSRVLLYSLYRFAEDCGDFMSFTLSSLMDESAVRDGVSPCQLFDLSRDELITMLQGLSVRYPDYISVSFTHDLESVTLNKDKTHQDVLALFN